MKALELFKSEFSQRHGIHFNNAGLAPISKRVVDRVSKTLSIHQEFGALKDGVLLGEIRETRAHLARFLGTEPELVSFTQNCAAALSQAALGFPLKPSDSVVTIDQEYASNYYPWKVACERAGAKLIVVESGPDKEVKLEELLSVIKPGVKIVAVSWVQFQTGSQIDLKTLGEHCHLVGAYLVVDAIQGLGQFPFQFSDLPVDFVTGASHKWFCSLNGQGFFAAKREFLDLLTPLQVGGGTYNRFGTFADPEAVMESSARKFEPGGYGFIPLFALDASLQLFLETGVSEIAKEISRLSQKLRGGIVDLGIKLPMALDQAGGITSFRLEREAEIQFFRSCQEQDVAVAKRGEFVRLSLHAFCRDDEVNRVLEILKGAL